MTRGGKLEYVEGVGTTWIPPRVRVTGLLGGDIVGGLARRSYYWTVYLDDGTECSFDPADVTVRYLDPA